MSEFEDLEKLLRLKRYEKPPEGYFEDFHIEFQARQRSEMLRQSAHGLFAERVSTWLWGLGHRKWLYAGGVTYAAVMIVVFLRPMGGRFGAPEAEATAVAPVTVEMKVPEIQNPAVSEPEETPSDSKPANENVVPYTGHAGGVVREL